MDKYLHARRFPAGTKRTYNKSGTYNMVYT